MTDVTHARRHLLITLLLPLMAMRAFVPAGFMPVVAMDGVSIVMCADGLPQPADDSGKRDDHSGDSSGTCPYSQASYKAPPLLPAALTFHPVLAAEQLEPHTPQLPALTGPPRSSVARAPPQLS